jgi:uncharacterized lipoprotein|tara:strand:+ start:115 stop:612 length:498 start_codon:yes stop_codon:yes gene_type:complete
MIKKILFVYVLIFLSSCSSDNKVVESPLTKEKATPGLFSKDASKGVSLSDLINPKSNPSSINVNGYLWRASLNILSIAPLISTDALGGTIITDWYINQNIKDKRIKISAYISTSELRSDGIDVKVHVQKLKNNIWSQTFTDKKLAIQIENSILNEARNLRINSNK